MFRSWTLKVLGKLQHFGRAQRLQPASILVGYFWESLLALGRIKLRAPAGDVGV
jgi:hypothetical protein